MFTQLTLYVEMDSTEANKIDFLGLFVADHVSAMLAYWDKNEVCRFANTVYRDWFGTTREEMIDKMTLKELVGSAIYEQNLPYVQGVLKGDLQVFEREIPLPSGGSRFVIANYFPDIVNGEVLGFVVHAADITSIKRMENQLLLSNEKIQEQNKRLINFANIVSHNLKSYANNLGSALEMYINAESEGEKNEMIGFLKEVSAGFSSTVENLADIVRVQNQDKLKLQTINLNHYIEKAISILRNQISQVKGVINNKTDRDIHIHANVAYIESIILNLLSNAIKYRHPQREPVIEISTEISAGKLKLKINDNGLGIDLERHGSKLFNIYQTFHGNADATGVGLYITKSQIEAMGGSIDVESEVNTGTSFIITLPVNQ